MLTCPPTRLGLTPADIASFDQRFAARHTTRQHRSQHAGLRIGRGAGHLTGIGIVSAEANLGHKRAESCSSQATICTIDDEQRSRGDDTTIHGDVSKAHMPISHDRQQVLDGAIDDSRTRANQARSVSHTAISVQYSSPLKPREPMIPEEPGDVQADREVQAITRGPEAQTEGDIGAPAASQQQPIPAIVTQSPSNPHLDPGAPVFVPRTRYGADATPPSPVNADTTRSASHTRATSATQSNTLLRIRSSFERNTQHPSSHQTHVNVHVEASASVQTTTRPPTRRQSRVNDQNALLQRPMTGLDRYPNVLPLGVPPASRRSSASQRQVILPHRQSSRQHLVDFHRSRRSHDEPIARTHHGSHLAVPMLQGPRSSSPAGSSSSVSTPNLLRGPPMPRAHHRSSSYNQRRNLSHNFENDRRPVAPNASRNSSDSALNTALEQLWLNRDSPLDELAQQLSRLSARPRSVGRSFERLPSAYNRPSLLNGDPFRLDPSSDCSSTDYEDDDVEEENKPIPPPKDTEEVKPIPPRKDSLDFHANYARLQNTTSSPPANAHLSPPSKALPKLPSTPPMPISSPLSKTTSSPRSALSPTSSTPRAQSLATTATPKVTVYDDNKPPGTQPETPADISHSRRRFRGRSDIPVPTHHSTADASDRHPHRHTYPSVPAPAQQQGPLSPRRRNAAELTPMRRQNATLHHQQHGDPENDIEGNLDGLEEDRRTWVRRREGGTLDVTPPREGRFERFLS